MRFWKSCMIWVASTDRVGNGSWVTVAWADSMLDLQVAQGPLEHGVQVGGHEVAAAGADAGEGEQIGDEPLHADGALERAGNIAPGPWASRVLRQAAFEELDVTADGPQRLLQVMRGHVSELLQVAVGAFEVLGGLLQGSLRSLALQVRLGLGLPQAQRGDAIGNIVAPVGSAMYLVLVERVRAVWNRW